MYKLAEQTRIEALAVTEPLHLCGLWILRSWHSAIVSVLSEWQPRLQRRLAQPPHLSSPPGHKSTLKNIHKHIRKHCNTDSITLRVGLGTKTIWIVIKMYVNNDDKPLLDRSNSLSRSRNKRDNNQLGCSFWLALQSYMAISYHKACCGTDMKVDVLWKRGK